MNKRSSRLIALLLALAMVLNIAPLTAFAEDVPSGGQSAPALQQDGGLSVADDFGTDEPEGASVSGVTVQYVLSGEYTYSRNNLLLGTETDKTVVPSEYNGTAPARCDYIGRKWDSEYKILTLLYKPHECSVELRYVVLVQKGGQIQALTFQELQNHEDRLEEGECIQAKKFLAQITGEPGDNIVLTTHNGVAVNQILPLSLPQKYIRFDRAEKSTAGNQFVLSYYGYKIAADYNPTDIVRSSDIVWNYGQDKINLFFVFSPIAESEVTYHPITWTDDEGNELTQTLVIEGGMPVYPDGEPTKADDSEEYSYYFAGWTPEIAEVTGPATYQATFTTGPKKESSEPEPSES